MFKFVLYNRRPAFNYLFLILFVVLSGCQKELSVENGTGGSGTGGTGTTGGAASFALVPSGNNCSDASVSGTFQAGTALNGSSKITVTVNVTKVGNWTYSTAPVNAIVFAGAGDFTATGSQVITLIAAGTPAAAGSFSVKLDIGGANCTVQLNVTAASGGGTGGGTTGTVYYKANIGGVNYAQDVTDTNGFEAGSGMGGADDVVFGGGINYGNPPLPAGKTEMGASKGVMHHYINSTTAQFYAFFAPGNYPYAPADYSNGDGVEVSWTDPTGENWSTQYGTAEETGSNFKIISVEDAKDLLGGVYIKVKMQFNCKLYSHTNGTMKLLTNGEMVAIFGKL